MALSPEAKCLAAAEPVIVVAAKLAATRSLREFAARGLVRRRRELVLGCATPFPLLP